MERITQPHSPCLFRLRAPDLCRADVGRSVSAPHGSSPERSRLNRRRAPVAATYRCRKLVARVACHSGPEARQQYRAGTRSAPLNLVQLLRTRGPHARSMPYANIPRAHRPVYTHTSRLALEAHRTTAPARRGAPCLYVVPISLAVALHLLLWLQGIALNSGSGRIPPPLAPLPKIACHLVSPTQ